MSWQISPKYTAGDWKAVDLSQVDNPDWLRAVDIFLDRVTGRFHAPVGSIRNHADTSVAEFSGFAIVAIDCLLIETLGQFYKGIDETPKGGHRQHFVDFLQDAASPHFAAEFLGNRARLFYQHFSNGILHHAQTKRESKVRIGQPSMVQLVDPTDEARGLIIDRNRLHDALEAEIHAYATTLRVPVPDNLGWLRSRGHFKAKMNFIAG